MMKELEVNFFSLKNPFLNGLQTYFPRENNNRFSILFNLAMAEVEKLAVDRVCEDSDVLISSVRRLIDINLIDDVPSIQFVPQCIEMRLSTISNPVGYVDHRGFLTNFGAEIEITSRIEAILDIGQEFVSLLYSFRSVSKAIPEVVS